MYHSMKSRHASSKRASLRSACDTVRRHPRETSSKYNFDILCVSIRSSFYFDVWWCLWRGMFLTFFRPFRVNLSSVALRSENQYCMYKHKMCQLPIYMPCKAFGANATIIRGVLPQCLQFQRILSSMLYSMIQVILSKHKFSRVLMRTLLY